MNDGQDSRIADFLRAYVQKRPRRGFGKCFDQARRNGHTWNHKRVYRVYKELGLNIRRGIKQKLPARVQQPLQAPTAPMQSLAMDFTSDRLANGRNLRTLNIIDEFNREVLTIEVDFSLPAQRVIRVLQQVVQDRGVPLSIRVDNGPEFIAEALAQWCEQHGIALNHIPPGKPQKNGFVERFNRSFREDVLDCYVFDSLHEVREIAWQWQLEYNEQRGHESLNNLTPIEYRNRYETGVAPISRTLYDSAKG